jgi:TrpR-related protein YerC/YecD
MKKDQNNDLISPVEELFEVLLLLETKKEAENFMRDLCTPQEISVLAERWRVCKLLDQGQLSYREIREKTGASLATITRIARFLRNEPHHGYIAILNKIKRTKVQ